MKQYRQDGIVRVTKQTAKRLYNQGKDIMLIPCNLRPMNHNFCYDTWVNNHMKEDEVSFDNLCNAYMYYNCNKETGGYISFYVKE